MLAYLEPTPEQSDQFLEWMWADGHEYWENTLRIMHMTWEEYARIFRTLGKVRAIFQDGNLAGFYWIEERDDTLHLHGLILRPEFQGQGIGSVVLTMLADEYKGRMEQIELGVYQGNKGAIRLYERMGFCLTRTLDDLHFNIMQKKLAVREAV